jgi:hypothetical protein
MNDKGTQGQEDLPLEEYKTLETRLYGELMRSCQRYFTKLRVISILGILDFVKQEVWNLERENMKFMGKGSDEQLNITIDKQYVE